MPSHGTTISNRDLRSRRNKYRRDAGAYLGAVWKLFPSLVERSQTDSPQAKAGEVALNISIAFAEAQVGRKPQVSL
jgi:hypothetical protein